MDVKLVTSDSDILKCKAAIQALRPSITDDLYLEDNHIAGSIAVFETGYNLFRGKYIYIDDLSTTPECRGKGYAGQLLDWILEYAKAQNIEEVHLDSGVSAERTDAHRLYLNKRFQIASLHFTHKIK